MAALALADCPRKAVLIPGIFVLAAALWVTEALPLFVTAPLVIGLQMLVLANPGGWPFLGAPAAGITVQSSPCRPAPRPRALPSRNWSFAIALTASCAMSLPISTPPNALAYSRGIVTTRDMARIGAVVGVTAGVLIVALGPAVLRFWGIL